MKLADEELELARLLAEEGSPLGASLTALRERGPDPSELGSLASRLSLRGIDVTVAAQAAVPAPKLWKKWALLGSGGGAAGALWLALHGSQPQPMEAADTAERARALELVSPEKPPVAARDGRVGGAAPRALPGALPAPSPSATSDAAASSTTGSGPTSTRSSPAPGAPAPNGAAHAAPSAEHPSAAGDRAARSSLAPANGRAPTPASAELSAPSEIELLRDARLALRQSPSAALAFTEQHARLYPQGKLSQERELIAISALVATGRRTAALSRGARFEQSFPTSPYRKQVGELLK